MKELQERIITYVTKVDALVSLEKLIAVSSAVGFSEGEVLAALSAIGNKLKVTARGDTVYYQVPPIKKPPIDHLKWVRENYVKMDETNDANHPAFADLDYSFLFLSPEEMKQFKIEQKGGFTVRRTYRSQLTPCGDKLASMSHG